MHQVLTNRLIELKSRKTDYSKAIRLLCDGLPRHNKEIYRLLLRDLVYHFEPTKTAPTRARVEKKGEMWTADSYETIAARIGKTMKKSISARTIQRYHGDLVGQGWVKTARYIFAGKNVLHRALIASKLDFDLHAALYATQWQQIENDPMEQFDEDVAKAVEQAREAAKLEGEKPARTAAENKDEARQVILTGDLLFGLGILTNTRRKTTKWAINRITQLVTTDLLSVDAMHTLKDAWENHAFAGMVENNVEHHQYWPNWLTDFYPLRGAICQGLAAYWFLDAEPSGHNWLRGEKLQRYLNCQKLVTPTFERLRESQRKAPSPADYLALDHEERIDLGRCDTYFQRLYPERDPSEIDLAAFGF